LNIFVIIIKFFEKSEFDFLNKYLGVKAFKNGAAKYKSFNCFCKLILIRV